MNTKSSIAVAALAAEYCSLIETASQAAPSAFCREVLRYLPRIYITVSDLVSGQEPEENGAIYQSMEEDAYESARTSMAALLGEYDTYLDTPVEEMRYSDTPVAASLSEKLADIYQNMYDLADTLRQAPEEGLDMVVEDLAYRFNAYLSQDLCDALRACNYLYQSNSLQ